MKKDKANLQNEKLVIEIQIEFEKKILNRIEGIESITANNMKRIIEEANETAFHKVNSRFLIFLPFENVSLLNVIYVFSLIRKRWAKVIFQIVFLNSSIII